MSRRGASVRSDRKLIGSESHPSERIVRSAGFVLARKRIVVAYKQVPELHYERPWTCLDSRDELDAVRTEEQREVGPCGNGVSSRRRSMPTLPGKAR
jgi:hypothetical protein